MTIDGSVLMGGFEKREIKIVDYDPDWPPTFQEHAAKIRSALADASWP
jgi:GrpB-like predicted nucleotidyltransferase (UPF0157 family)